jgi:hypothetical protein
LVNALIWLHGPEARKTSLDSPGLMVAYLEQWLNGLVYELFFPGELRARKLNLFDETAKLNVPDLSKLTENQKWEALQEMFVKSYNSNAALRGMLFDLRSIDVVRVIEEAPDAEAKEPTGNEK